MGRIDGDHGLVLRLKADECLLKLRDRIMERAAIGAAVDENHYASWFAELIPRLELSIQDSAGSTWERIWLSGNNANLLA